MNTMTFDTRTNNNDRTSHLGWAKRNLVLCALTLAQLENDEESGLVQEAFDLTDCNPGSFAKVMVELEAEGAFHYLTPSTFSLKVEFQMMGA